MNDEVLRKAADVLRAATTVTREFALVPSVPLGPATAGPALGAAEHVVTQRIASSGQSAVELSAILVQLRAIRAAVGEAELARRSAAVTDVHDALRRLHAVDSLDTLVERAPVEINRLGYDRSLFSRLAGSRWIARSADARADAPLAAAMVRVGTATPGLVTGESPEAAVVRRRAPILVPDAQANPRVHPQLKALTDTRDYICAPLVAQGRVVGLMHADRTRETGRVDQFDRDLLGLFAEGLGFVFERTYLAQRLQSIKLSLEAEARSVGDLVDSFFESGPLPVPTAHPRTEGGPLAELTRRELEVLRHLANGQTNVEIAADLFVSPGTVKCHVTSVLRKLGAANRAEAVSRYHRLSR